MDLAPILEAFGLSADPPPVSLYAYAPVYRLHHGPQAVVLKRTGLAYSSGPAIAQWTREVAGQGVAVVAPVPDLDPNPRPLPSGAGDDRAPWWVVYPFVAGVPYTGAAAQVSAAGQLLGRMHAAAVPGAAALGTFPGLPHHPPERQQAVFEAAKAAVAEFAPDAVEGWRATAARRRAEDTAAQARLQAAGWTAVGASFDFKASNLVFAAQGPVLIDPDHAVHLPRVFDLATSALLFECDVRTTPGALWSAAQWRAFREAYFAQVGWSPEERALWPDALRAAWVYHVPWLLAHWPEGWQDPRERAYLRALAVADLGVFSL